LCNTISPEQVVQLLDSLFFRFDSLTIKNGLQRLKTIGDAYVVVGNMLNDEPDLHAQKVVDLALDVCLFDNSKILSK